MYNASSQNVVKTKSSDNCSNYDNHNFLENKEE